MDTTFGEFYTCSYIGPAGVVVGGVRYCALHNEVDPPPLLLVSINGSNDLTLDRGASQVKNNCNTDIIRVIIIISITTAMDLKAAARTWPIICLGIII